MKFVIIVLLIQLYNNDLVTILTKTQYLVLNILLLLFGVELQTIEQLANREM